MAERRMFSKKITESDQFLSMPLSAQCLYFHLSMNADDDGFVNSPKKVLRMIGASDDDFGLLILRRFILQFQTGVIVIKHWRMNNYLRSDRYKQTDYTDEMNLLAVKENGSYTEKANLVYQTDTSGIRSIGEISKEKNRLGSRTHAREEIVPVYDDSNNPQVDQNRLNELIERRKKCR